MNECSVKCEIKFTFTSPQLIINDKNGKALFENTQTL